MLAVLVVLVVLVAWETSWSERLRAAGFDMLQTRLPRTVGSLPVRIVEIDQKSLRALGQWPWPRNLLAQLVGQIQQAAPAVIALNILMPEADALSPERLLLRAAPDAQAALHVLREMQSNDAVLARALADAPSVLAVAGLPEATGMALRAAPVSVSEVHRQNTTPQRLDVAQYAGALTSLDQLNRRASGWGLMSADASRGVLRRMPLVAAIDGTLLPALAIEMLRVAAGAQSLRVEVSGARVLSVSVGGLRFATEGDGALRIYFSKHRSDRFVSAVDVLEGRVDAAQLQRQLVIVGLLLSRSAAGRPMSPTRTACARNWLSRSCSPTPCSTATAAIASGRCASACASQRRLCSSFFEGDAAAFDPLAQPRDAPAHQSDTPGGWGLQLVAQMAANIRYERAGRYNRLWLEMQRQTG